MRPSAQQGSILTPEHLTTSVVLGKDYSRALGWRSGASQQSERRAVKLSRCYCVFIVQRHYFVHGEVSDQIYLFPQSFIQLTFIQCQPRPETVLWVSHTKMVPAVKSLLGWWGREM